MTEHQKRSRAAAIARVLYSLVYDNRDLLVGAVHTHAVCAGTDALTLLAGTDALKVEILKSARSLSTNEDGGA